MNFDKFMLNVGKWAKVISRNRFVENLPGRTGKYHWIQFGSNHHTPKARGGVGYVLYLQNDGVGGGGGDELDIKSRKFELNLQVAAQEINRSL